MTPTTLSITLFVAVGAVALSGPQHTMSHSRANQGMGFDQDKTTHHFLLEKTGGTIEVTAKDVKDTDSVAQVR